VTIPLQKVRVECEKKTVFFSESMMISFSNFFSSTFYDKDGKSFDIKADNVLVSVVYNPAPVVQEGKDVHLVGDYVSAGNLRTVIWRAWDVAMKL